MTLPGCSGKQASGECGVVWLCEKQTEQPVSLFPDADTALTDSLGLDGGVPSSISAFLIRQDTLCMLFDTGFGLPDGGIRKGLDSLGIAPEDIDCIYLTHFHGDHIGGMLDSTGMAYYPKARVYASQAEYDAWTAMPSGKNVQVMDMLSAYGGRINLFSPGDTLPGNVVAIDASGHTPGHTAYRVGDILIWGDIMHGMAIQLVRPEICAVYDMDRLASVGARVRMVGYARENGLLVAGMHLPQGFIDFRQKAFGSGTEVNGDIAGNQ